MIADMMMNQLPVAVHWIQRAKDCVKDRCILQATSVSKNLWSGVILVHNWYIESTLLYFLPCTFVYYCDYTTATYLSQNVFNHHSKLVFSHFNQWELDLFSKWEFTYNAAQSSVVAMVTCSLIFLMHWIRAIFEVSMGFNRHKPANQKWVFSKAMVESTNGGGRTQSVAWPEPTKAKVKREQRHPDQPKGKGIDPRNTWLSLVSDIWLIPT